MYTTRAPLPAWSLPKKIFIGVIVGGSVSFTPIKSVLASDYFVKKQSLKSADNKIVTLSMDLHEFADNVRKEIRLKPKTREKIKFFCTKGLDLTIIGNTNLTGPTTIGIPYTFKFTKVDDVDPNVVGSLIGMNKLRQEDWYKTENGKKLIASLVLSEEGRKFAIAREIVAADSEIVIYRDIITLLIVVMGILSYEYLQPRTASLIGKWPSIVAIASMLTIIYATLGMVAYDYVYHSCAKTDDSRTFEVTKWGYRKGAIEYFEKLIERNKSLRALLIDGPERFDADGNPIAWYKLNLSSFKERLDDCKKFVETMKDDPVI